MRQINIVLIALLPVVGDKFLFFLSLNHSFIHPVMKQVSH